MKIGALKEIAEDEARVAITPESATQLQKLGFSCVVESGAGIRSGITDKDYRDAGVKVSKTSDTVIKDCDIIIKVRPPEPDEAKKLREGQTLLSFIYPGQNPELLDQFAKQGTHVLAMDMVPRISRAQKMDCLLYTSDAADD